MNLDKTSISLGSSLLSGEDLYEKQVKARKVRRYHIWFRNVVARDNSRCYKCNVPSSEAKLTVHHIVSYTKYPNLRVDPDNGLTLCSECHADYHRQEGREPTLGGLVRWLGIQPGFTFALEVKMQGQLSNLEEDG